MLDIALYDKCNLFTNTLDNFIDSIFVTSQDSFKEKTIDSVFNNRILPESELPYEKIYRLPNLHNIFISKDRRNKKRILNNDRDISPFKDYYQN